MADEVSLSTNTEGWLEAATRVYYHIYESSLDMNDATKSILDRAKQDVMESCKYLV